MLEEQIAGGLVLRSLVGPADVERLVEFHSLIHGASIETMTRALISEHPAARAEHWLYVEDQATRRVVAGLCLLPWELQYAGVRLRSGEMGIVGTLEEYRHRGLIRALNRRFQVLLAAGGFDISQIQGIPYFYRQLGYEYAMPLEAWCQLELHALGDTVNAAGGYTLRPAGLADLPALAQLYEAACGALSVSTVRDAATWRYLLGPALATATAGEPWLIEGPGATPAGYLRVMREGFGDGLICGEASLLGAEAALAALRWLVALARERGKPYVRLNLPRSHILYELALRHGAHDRRRYAWQIALPDPPALLRRLAPVLDQRLAGGAFAGLSRTIVLDLYRSAIAMRFEQGRLLAVDGLPGGARGDIRLPPQLLAPLLFGWRTFDELAYIFPDASANGVARALADALFPRAEAFLYSPY